MRKKELATLMEALPSALETLAVARFFGTHVDGDEAGEPAPTDLSSTRSPRRRTAELYSEADKAELLRKMSVNYILSQQGPSWGHGQTQYTPADIGKRQARRIEKIINGSNTNSTMPFDGVSCSMMSWNTC